jgi:threonylcarbamoyladenosine tRNA methylthiotransferase MtaB
MPHVARNLVQQRAATLRRTGHHAFSRRLASEVGNVREILVEQTGFGRTEHYLPIKLDSGRAGEIISTKIVATDGKTLTGHILRAAA